MNLGLLAERFDFVRSSSGGERDGLAKLPGTLSSWGAGMLERARAISAPCSLPDVADCART